MGRRAHRTTGSLLDEEFDRLGSFDREMEEMKFYDDPACRQGDLAGGLSNVSSSRKRRKTTPSDDPEVLELPEDPPPGWAEP